MSKTPENTSENTAEALQAEVERLRTKNVELLAELKAAKAAATDTQAALEAMQGERDTAAAEVRALRLDGPVERLLDEVASPNAADVFASLFARHYKFALGDNGPEIQTRDGGPVTVLDDAGKPRPAMFTDADLRAVVLSSPSAEAFEHVTVVSHASGGGAPGSRGGHSHTPDKPAPAAPPAAPPAQQFGIR